MAEHLIQIVLFTGCIWYLVRWTKRAWLGEIRKY